jgi:hypothetical protein
MAVAVKEHGREIVEVYLQAMRKGDWRAAELLDEARAIALELGVRPLGERILTQWTSAPVR